MRHDENAARVARGPSFGDRLLKLSGRVFGALLDLIFLPFELLFRGFEAIGRVIRKRATGIADEPCSSRLSAGQMAVTGRLLVLLPIMVFVLFPFYWVIVTSFKSTPQISERTSIFWPQPFTMEHYQSLLFTTPFLTWFGNSVLVAAVSTMISVVFAALAAYALSRLKFLGSAC